MRRYLLRFVDHVKGLPDFTALTFTQCNRYESMVKPVLACLEDHDVDIRYGTTVRVEENGGVKSATSLLVTVDDVDQDIELTEDDLVFMTNRSITESTTCGHHRTPAPPTDELGGAGPCGRTSPPNRRISAGPRPSARGSRSGAGSSPPPRPSRTPVSTPTSNG